MKTTNFMMAFRNGELTMSLCTIAFGILLVAAPGTTLQLICIISGLLLLLAGIARLLPVVFGGRNSMGLAGSVLLILAGIFLLFHPADAIGLTSTIIGIIVLLVGISKYSTVQELRACGVSAGTGIASSILTILAGVLILFRPIGTAAFLTVLLGIDCILVGLTTGASVLFLRRAETENAKRPEEQSNVIEGEFRDL